MFAIPRNLVSLVIEPSAGLLQRDGATGQFIPARFLDAPNDRFRLRLFVRRGQDIHPAPPARLPSDYPCARFCQTCAAAVQSLCLKDRSVDVARSSQPAGARPENLSH